MDISNITQSKKKVSIFLHFKNILNIIKQLYELIIMKMSIETLNFKENEFKKNLKELKKEIEYTDPIPEMSTKEIMSLSNEDIINLVSDVESNREEYFNHKDINGLYAIINGKKVYFCDDNHLPNHNGTYLRYEFNRTGYFSLFTKKGNKYQGIYYNDGDRYDNKKIYKGKLTFNNDGDFGIRVSGK